MSTTSTPSNPLPDLYVQARPYDLTTRSFPPRPPTPVPTRPHGTLVDLTPLVLQAVRYGELAVRDHPDYPRPGSRRSAFWRTVGRTVDDIGHADRFDQLDLWSDIVVTTKLEGHTP